MTLWGLLGFEPHGLHAGQEPSVGPGGNWELPSACRKGFSKAPSMDHALQLQKIMERDLKVWKETLKIMGRDTFH